VELPNREIEETAMAMYVGMRMASRGTINVVVIEAPLCRPLDPRWDVRNHSPDGFEWGYQGSGPAQLALALLCDVTGDNEVAQSLYQRFKFHFVAGLPKEGWAVSHELIEAWIIDQIGHCKEIVSDDEVIELGGPQA